MQLPSEQLEKLVSDYTLYVNKDSFKDLQKFSDTKWFKPDEVSTEFSVTLPLNSSEQAQFRKLRMEIIEMNIPHMQKLLKVEPPLDETLIRVLSCFDEYPTYPASYLL